MVARLGKLDYVALAALACYVASVLPFIPREVSYPAGSALCFLLTGVVGASAILPRRASGTAWFTAIVSWSVGVGIFGALILDLIPTGLVRIDWVTFAFATTIIAFAIARARGAGSSPDWKRPQFAGLTWLSGGKIAASILIVAAAIAISVTGPNCKNKPFTEVWFVPDGSAHSPVGATGAVFGIKSHESSKEDFIVVMNTGKQVTTHRVTLAPKQAWTQTFSVAGERPVATVYRDRLASAPYRTVWFARR
jgi:hypothetical protein